MKNKIKEIIKNNYKFAFMFILGIIVAGGGVYAATTISGKAITYDNSSSGLSSTNVQDAVDELSGKADTSSIKTLPNIIAAYEYSTATATMCKTGEESTCVATYCYTKSTSGSCKPGTIIKYKVNDTKIKNFNVISDKGNTITMQSIETLGSTNWSNHTLSYGPVNLTSSLDINTNNWNNVNYLDYNLGSKGIPTTCATYNACFWNAYSTTITSKARLITMQEAASLGCNNDDYGSCPEWLVFNSKGTTGMIWTATTVYDTTDQAWVVSHYQYLEKWSITEAVAFKAVVDIDKPL